jgi:hypothetical protein
MIWPGVISIGIPSPGVEGRGGELAAKVVGDTGRVGSDTVIGSDVALELVFTVM